MSPLVEFQGNGSVSVAEGLTVNQPDSAVHGSEDEDMIQRLPHIIPHYRADNATGYVHLVTANLGTQYTSTLSPFKRTKDGHGSNISLAVQFAGPSHWDAEAKKVN